MGAFNNDHHASCPDPVIPRVPPGGVQEQKTAFFANDLLRKRWENFWIDCSRLAIRRMFFASVLTEWE